MNSSSASMSQSPPPELAAPPALRPWMRTAAGLLLLMLMVVLAVRMSGSELVRETLGQKGARVQAAAGPEGAAVGGAPFIGPMFTAMEGGLVLLAAAGAAWLAAMGPGLPRGKVAHGVLVTAVCGWAVASAFHASNRFAGLTGAADLCMVVVAGWAVAVLCWLIGPAGQKAVIAGLVAILALWVCKGYLQKFVEYPDLTEYIREHRDEVLKSQGIDPQDDVKSKLYLTRSASGEVMGFLAFSNVYATGLIGLLSILTALLTAKVLAWTSREVSPEAAREPVKRKIGESGRRERKEGEIPLDAVAFWVSAAVLAAGVALLPMTGSKGGLAIGIAAVAAVAAGGVLWRWVVRYRWMLIAAGCVAVLAGAASIVAYGLRHDALPSKSLLFRWHYWTAAGPMIRDHPVWGVGLNNFGDYYTAYKRPSSPEDVQDPHSFFVRLAAETGLPGMLLMGMLLAWLLGRVLLGRSNSREGPAAGESTGMIMTAGIAGAAIWAAVYLCWFESPVAYTVAITLILAVLACAMFAATLGLLQSIDDAGESRSGMIPVLRYVALGGTIGALAMLAYDQINMALVTGPAAMLFWMILGLGTSTRGAPAPVRSRSGRIAAGAAGTVLLAAAVGLFSFRWTVEAPYDPARFEYAFIERMEARDVAGAKAALEQALARYPGSGELRMQHIKLMKDSLHAPVAEEIRELLKIDRANARIRVTLAMEDSDLPPKERAQILREALRLDQALPPEEYKRLPPETIAEVQRKIAQLEGGAGGSSSAPASAP